MLNLPLQNVMAVAVYSTMYLLGLHCFQFLDLDILCCCF